MLIKNIYNCSICHRFERGPCIDWGGGGGGGAAKIINEHTTFYFNINFIHFLLSSFASLPSFFFLEYPR